MSDAPLVGVIINPHARAAKRAGLAAAIARTAGPALIRTTASLVELDGAMAEFADAQVSAIAVCGGDGTHTATIGALLRRYDADAAPPYLFLPGGTMNTVARNLGARGAPEERLRRWRQQGHRSLTSHTLVTVQSGDELRVGFIFAAAMGARFLEAYYAGFGGDGVSAILGPGPVWAAALGLRTVASCLVQGPWAKKLFGPLDVDLVVDGQPAPGPFRLLVASTVPNVGLGMRVAWQAGRVPHRIQLVASGVTPVQLGLQLPRVLTGRPLSGAPHIDRMMERATLRFSEPTVYTLDGELFTATELTVTAGATLRVIDL